MTFRLVRAEPSEGMIHEQYAQYGGGGLDMDGRFKAMLAASEPLTDAEIDELCRLWFGEEGIWDRSIDAELRELATPSAGHCEGLRNDDRTRMRAFIAALEGHVK